MYEGIVQELIDELGRLPGIGPKSAQRIAFHIVQTEQFDVSRLAEILLEVRDKVRFCEICGNVAEESTDDRPGNHRADTLENILKNPKVGLFFLIPGKTEQLRVSGTARIVKDADLMASMAVKGRNPALAIVVEVEEAFFHCSKCMIRSRLWQPGHWPSLDGLPRLAETMVDAGTLELTAEQMHEIVLRDEKERLY